MRKHWIPLAMVMCSFGLMTGLACSGELTTSSDPPAQTHPGAAHPVATQPGQGMGQPQHTVADDKVPTKKQVQAFAREGNVFGLTLYERLVADAKADENLFASPLSVRLALMMAYAGSRGETASEFETVLRLMPVSRAWPESHPDHRVQNHLMKQLMSNTKAPGEDQKPPLQLSIANALWLQQGFEVGKPFADTLATHYGSPARHVDFIRDTETARITINNWVEQRTQDRIKDLFPKDVLDADTRTVLVNAIYFLGNWDVPFADDHTQRQPFHLADGKKVNVPLMYRQGHMPYYADEHLQMIELAYKGGDVSMVVLLPRAKPGGDAAKGLTALEKRLTQPNLDRWVAQMQRRDVHAFLPRFKMTTQFEMGAILQSMGLVRAFDDGRADFAGISDKHRLVIQAVMHKAFVEVNERGTEAAAATGIAVGVTSMPVDPPPTLRADHPFVFVIRSTQDGSILFMGRVANPGVE